jgi:hypothetical protein
MTQERLFRVHWSGVSQSGVPGEISKIIIGSDSDNAKSLFMLHHVEKYQHVLGGIDWQEIQTDEIIASEKSMAWLEGGDYTIINAQLDSSKAGLQLPEDEGGNDEQGFVTLNVNLKGLPSVNLIIEDSNNNPRQCLTLAQDMIGQLFDRRELNYLRPLNPEQEERIRRALGVALAKKEL